MKSKTLSEQANQDMEPRKGQGDHISISLNHRAQDTPNGGVCITVHVNMGKKGMNGLSF